MGEKEKKIAERIAEVLEDLPEEKKQYFIGFAEGLATKVSLSSTPAA